jgi:hypothetical protein
MDTDDFPLTPDCQRLIGTEIYQFFSPLHFGDFVLCCWRRESVSARKSVVKSIVGSLPIVNVMEPKEELFEYGLSIYEEGEIIDPSADRRFRKYRWSKSHINWFNRWLSRAEICQIFSDVYVAADEQDGI